jgi:hypothetical protein
MTEPKPPRRGAAAPSPPSLPHDLEAGPALEEEELVMFLERDQLVSDKLRPVPRARLSRRTSIALWTLRVCALLVGVMVIYTFFWKLGI